MESNQQTHDAADEYDEAETARMVLDNDEVDQFEETVKPKSTNEEVTDGEREKLTVLTSKEPDEPPSALTQSRGSGATASDSSASAPKAQEASAQSAPSVVVCFSEPQTETLNLSPLLCHLPGEKKKKAEENSVDSGQHSDDESEGSVNEDTLAASTAALQGSHAGLDVLDAAEEEIPVHLRPSAKLQVKANVFPCRRSEPFQKPLKPSSKPKSASIGDLLSDSLGSDPLKTSRKAEDGSVPAFKNSVTNLETEVALEIKNTSELLSQAQERNHDEAVPEDLLTRALDKLQKADCVLREVKRLKLAKNFKRRSL